jgi:tetratricopeptide (TPR) repeat protein
LQVLQLEAREFTGDDRWRWVLTGEGGAFLADHQVELDASRWEWEAFTGLQGYLRSHVAPDRRLEQEAAVLAQVGAWAGEQILGPVGAALVDAAPAVVRVVVPADPPEAARLLFWPLELAHAGARPVGVQDVTLVMQQGAEDALRRVAGVGDRLRVLGLFSLPTGERPLNLRRERQALVRLFEEIGAQGRGVDVRVLQYGVTRTRLREVLDEAEGWDVIHVSGHGLPGELELETADGSPDRVSSGELSDLLWRARERLKLVTVSACWSAAVTLAEQRRLLRLPLPKEARGEGGEAGYRGGPDSEAGRHSGPNVETGRGGDGVEAGAKTGGLAPELTGRLGCAVLAMRYPVTDGFAISLAERLYGLAAGQGQPVARALGIALADPNVVADPPTWQCPALSGVTPTLFGARAVGLTLEAPQRSGPVSFDPGALKLARFPAQPDRFVGRTSVMARASAALAPRSGSSGVLLHGMPGGGKTACALELAYTHEDAFGALVWFKAPDEDQDIADALSRFALTLETSLSGLRMVHLLDDQATLAAFLPDLTELLERNRILIVIDNAESLLTNDGLWRDARWGLMVGALASHEGLGRVLVTSRRVPGGLDGRVQVLTIDALSLDEALLLARELPHLSALIDGDINGIGLETARTLAAGVLEVAQGHPKLLELADGAAARPDRLRALVGAADAAWREAGGLPTGFFATGETVAGGEDFLQVLGAWTRAVVDGLTPAGRNVFCFICCLEESDRIRPVLEDNWADLWTRLGRDGEAPGLEENLAALAATGLVASQPGAQGGAVEYGVHPGVAAAGRDLAEHAFREAVDTELAAFWTGIADYSKGREAEEDAGGMVIRAGLGASPYLLRLHAWRQAQGLLEEVLIRDRSRAAVGAVLPALRAIVAAVASTDSEPAALNTLARALAVIDPAAGEQQMAAALDAALNRQNYWSASVAAGYLANYRMQAGRLGEALQIVDDMASYSRRAGLGPWTQLGDQVQRLQILNFMGQAGQVFDEVRRLREQMDSLPATWSEAENSPPWTVREMLLDTGRRAASLLGRWAEALELSAALVASKRGRGAPDTEIAWAQANDYFPLLRLGRIDDAIEVLVACREVFEAAHNIQALGKVLSSLADAEDERGHGDVAIGLECDALRYCYLAVDVDGIQVSHYNLGNYLFLAGQPGEALVHHLAAALLRAITGSRGMEDPVQAAAGDLRAAGETALPADAATLCDRAGEVPGVHLDRLLATLARDPAAADQAWPGLVDQIRAQAAAAPDVVRYLARWDPAVAGVTAAARGDAAAATATREHLSRYADSDSWAKLVAVLTRILDGDRGEDLAAGLDEIDAAVVARALDSVAGQVSVPAMLWPAMGLGPVLGNVTAAARGDNAAAQQARQDLDALAEQSELGDLTGALDQILGGNRDPGLASTLDDPTERAVVTCVLEHIGVQAEPEGT